MNYRNLGELNVSSLGLGCMGLSESYGVSDDIDSINLINRAIENGINFFDTADMYGLGHNEKLLGQAIKHQRNKIVIASKCGIVRDPNNLDKREVNNQPKYIAQCCEASLKRLDIDVIDLYYLHRIDKHTPIEESISALADLVKAGKIRYIGLSEANAKTIRKAHSIHPITAIQSEYSILSRQVEENDVLKTCKQLNIGFVAYSPLSRALLSKEFNLQGLQTSDVRKSMPRFQQENYKKNKELVLELASLSEEKKCSLPQLALAWLLAREPFVVPIPGTKKQNYLLENIGAVNIKLNEDEMNRINFILSITQVAGTRYSHELMKEYNLES